MQFPDRSAAEWQESENMNDRLTWQAVVIRVTLFGAIMAIGLWPTGISAQSDIQEDFRSSIEQKVDARPVPAKITTADNGALKKNGYIEIGTVRVWEKLSWSIKLDEVGPDVKKALSDKALARAAASGGDLVRFDKKAAEDYIEGLEEGKWIALVGSVWRQDSKLAAEIAFQAAMRSGNVEEVASLLDKAGPRNPDELLQRAAEGGHIKLASYLIAQRGARLSAIHAESECRTCSWDADIVKRILGGGQSFSADDLKNAVTWKHGGSREILDALLQRGSWTPETLADAFQYACFEGEIYSGIKSLLERGVPADYVVSLRGETCLHLSAADGGVDLTNVLLDHGADVNATSKPQPNKITDSYLTPFAEAARDLMSYAGKVDSIREKLLGLLLDRSAIVDIYGRWDSEKSAALREILLAHNADVNRRDRNGQTGLMHAGYRGDPGPVEQLLTLGADKTLRDNQGRTAADIARESLQTNGAYLTKDDRKNFEKTIKLLNR